MVFKDLKVNVVPEGTECVAERQMADGSYVIYRATLEDVAILVKDLEEVGVKDDLLLDETYWLKHKIECQTLSGGRCRNDNCNGRCRYVSSTGGFNYCDCQ
jgi:hypothetical protein